MAQGSRRGTGRRGGGSFRGRGNSNMVRVPTCRSHSIWLCLARVIGRSGHESYEATAKGPWPFLYGGRAPQSGVGAFQKKLSCMPHMQQAGEM